MSTKTTSTTLAREGECVPAATRCEPRVIAPHSDIYEKTDSFLLLIDLPGVSGESLDVHFEENQLTISGAATSAGPGEGTPGHVEFEPISYRRVFALSDEIDTDSIEAALEHGVLRLTLGKKEAAKPRKVEVKLS